MVVYFSNIEFDVKLEMIFAGGLVVVILIIVILGFSFQKDKNQYTQDNMILKLIYTFLIGIFMAVFVGVGIAAFYVGPKFPEQPAIFKYCSPDIVKNSDQSEESKSQIEEFDKKEKEYQLQSQLYNRNTSVIALIASIIIVIVSLTLFKKLLVIADGLLLGGVLTLLYSVIRGFGAENNLFRFAVVSMGLIISLLLGYVKFIQPDKKHPSKSL